MVANYTDSIFWVETDKIKPNPFQPRREFDQEKLSQLAESIRQYGILQPLVVTRHELERDGGLVTEYELIAGERRLRASKIAGLSQVPVLIRTSEDSDQMKLELAIIENLQREDLNPIDRALAFKRLEDEFGFNREQIGKKIGRSRAYVANTMRILNLPQDMQQAVVEGTITEGHTRPLLMLIEKPEEQRTLFLEILNRKLNVREAEHISRNIATERVRKPGLINPEIRDIEKRLSDTLGTRVSIEATPDSGGRLVIKYFSTEELRALFEKIGGEQEASILAEALSETEDEPEGETGEGSDLPPVEEEEESLPVDESTPPEDDIYSLKNFSI